MVMKDRWLKYQSKHNWLSLKWHIEGSATGPIAVNCTIATICCGKREVGPSLCKYMSERS